MHVYFFFITQLFNLPLIFCFRSLFLLIPVEKSLEIVGWGGILAVKLCTGH